MVFVRNPATFPSADIPVLFFAEPNQLIYRAAGGDRTITVSKTGWTVESVVYHSGSGWLTYIGESTTSFVLTASEQTAEELREATITLSDNDSDQKAVIGIQQDSALEITNVKFYIRFDGSGSMDHALIHLEWIRDEILKQTILYFYKQNATEWNDSTTYSVGSRVIYEEEVYQAINSNRGVLPTDTNDWFNVYEEYVSFEIVWENSSEPTFEHTFSLTGLHIDDDSPHLSILFQDEAENRYHPLYEWTAYGQNQISRVTNDINAYKNFIDGRTLANYRAFLVSIRTPQRSDSFAFNTRFLEDILFDPDNDPTNPFTEDNIVGICDEKYLSVVRDIYTPSSVSPIGGIYYYRELMKLMGQANVLCVAGTISISVINIVFYRVFLLYEDMGEVFEVVEVFSHPESGLAFIEPKILGIGVGKYNMRIYEYHFGDGQMLYNADITLGLNNISMIITP